MNRKTIILLVAMVATILPAVAVADVMVQGSISVEQTITQHRVTARMRIMISRKASWMIILSFAPTTLLNLQKG